MPSKGSGGKGGYVSIIRPVTKFLTQERTVGELG